MNIEIEETDDENDEEEEAPPTKYREEARIEEILDDIDE